MRPAGRIKAGYLPAPDDAIDALLDKLEPLKTGDTCTAFDPCGGEGRALQRLGAGLGIPESRLYAVELDENRAAECRTNMPEAHVLGPASFYGTSIRDRSMSLVLCNPPYDDEYGGGRVETQFMAHATSLLVTGGVMVLVAPYNVAMSDASKTVWMEWFEDVSLFPFPDEVRQYNEVFMVGRRISQWRLPKDQSWSKIWRSVPPRKYMVPPANGPGKWWRKTSLVDSEIIAALESSPLQRMFEPPPEPGLPRPPLALGTGHLALLLSSGYLDGVVRPADEPAHIVRGCCSKVEEVSDISVTETKGSESTKTTYTERIQMSVRTLDSQGQLRTLA